MQLVKNPNNPQLLFINPTEYILYLESPISLKYRGEKVIHAQRNPCNICDIQTVVKLQQKNIDITPMLDIKYDMINPNLLPMKCIIIPIIKLEINPETKAVLISKSFFHELSQ